MRSKELEFIKDFGCGELSSEQQDMFDHIDVIADGKGYDVKAAKRINRHSDIDYNYHWVELRNVRGDFGWLFGKADFIVFETEFWWVIVDREKLKDWISRNLTKDIGKGVYQRYGREGREDLITLVPTYHLVAISDIKLNKS